MSQEVVINTSHQVAVDLVQRIIAGERQAEGELVEHYGDKLAFLLRRWTRELSTAEDLYQETFRLAIEKIRAGEVRQPERLPAFLRSLAKNLSTHYYRRGEQRFELSEPEDFSERLPSTRSIQLDRVLGQEKALLVRRVLLELPNERDREVLSRFYIAEEGKEQICADLGIAVEHLKRVLFRARQRYKTLYERSAAVSYGTQDA